MKHFILMMIAMISPSMASAAPMVNSSFETGGGKAAAFQTFYAGDPAISGWTIVSGSVDLIYDYWLPSDGNYSLDLAGDREGVIEQSAQTAIGQTYRVTFDMSANPDNGNGARSLSVSAAGTSATYTYNQYNTKTSMNWLSQSFDFTATSGTTVLRFAALDGGIFGPALDNVAIAPIAPSSATSPVPEPATWAMLLFGFGAMGHLLRRRHKAHASKLAGDRRLGLEPSRAAVR